VKSDSVPGGAQALGALRARVSIRPYDVALIDLQMPEMDGLTLARRIRADPALASMRLLMMSSVGGRPETGAGDLDVWLTKPVKQAQVHDALAMIMSAEPVRMSNLRPYRAAPEPKRVDQSRRRIRILVAEDNMVNQRLALHQLAKLGFTADPVGNGIEAVRALEQIAYDIVLMDCQMPEMDGYEATIRIREREAQTRHTIIIAMTAHALEGDREKCLSYGMDDYISKPVKLEVLESALTRWMSKLAPADGEAIVVPATSAPATNT
jgi:CheY-like chemotaxis protein